MATFTLFGQTGASGTGSDGTAYSLGVQFSVTQSGYTLSGIWFFSPAGAGTLPATVGLYAVSGQSLVTSNAATWSGAAGSGWVHAPLTSPPSLTPSTNYKAVVSIGLNPGNWFTATAGYWTSGGPGASGITNGPLTAPNSGGGAEGQDSFIQSSSITYPGNPSGSSANYWIDPEIFIASPQILASPATLSIPQTGTGTFGVTLSAAPGSNVTVLTSRHSGNAGLSVTAGGSLTFTPANYNTPQNVTVTADAVSTGAAVFNAASAGYDTGVCTVTEAQTAPPIRSALNASIS